MPKSNELSCVLLIFFDRDRVIGRVYLIMKYRGKCDGDISYLSDIFLFACVIRLISTSFGCCSRLILIQCRLNWRNTSRMRIRIRFLTWKMPTLRLEIKKRNNREFYQYLRLNDRDLTYQFDFWVWLIQLSLYLTPEQTKWEWHQYFPSDTFWLMWFLHESWRTHPLLIDIAKLIYKISDCHQFIKMRNLSWLCLSWINRKKT